MLQTIHIKNFAIIDQLNVQFNQGMSVLTGETGAGKSIIIDALSLVAGGRASSEMIRHECDKAVVQALFDIASLSPVQQFLEHEGLNGEDNELIITREIHRSGKSQVRINGMLANVTILKHLGTLLMDIHGQHEHQFLMNDAKHLSLLDSYGAETIANERALYMETYTQYSRLKKQLKQLMEIEQNDTQRVNLLKRHIADIEEVNPQMREDVLLEEELKTLANDKKVASVLLCLDTLLTHEETGVKQILHQSLSQLYHIVDLSKEYEQMAIQLNDVLSGVNDMSKQLSHALDRIEFNEERLSEVENRLAQLDKLKERYGQNIDEVIVYYNESKSELDRILNKDKHLVDMQQQFLHVREQLLIQGKKLTTLRQALAVKLEQSVKEQLMSLYMDKVEFKVQFKSDGEKIKIRATGLDDVEFLVATNVGEPLKPLVKVASGGELSRMMLALKAIFASQQTISTIIFDEIDTGVSGRVAQAIANKMHDISKNIQVLCITHLPQVAAKSDYHLYVKKIVVDNRTTTELHCLSHEQRRQEVARMFAGDTLTQAALHHADELLQHTELTHK
ncbi:MULTISPECIES: DNA repair protein RecN [unclassified Granulicatella]|uniref:DNA repair protein RecN n=1 Tax=unclassified Granulicatella TaxID=2630493 RepID=UPI0010739208|nr:MULTISPECIES: DNA repair protein RecN [unclassified Granulicatella]MBF0780397.1 DNA repair protein RecN [Granulicatella sp. 19428wC4_WM01]TFU95436.1 DNA repair protein RecN [Granulicatella sp. WM01]